MTVAVLFARHNSVYKMLPDCDVWDKRRDALLWPGGCPVVAHPPCALWGKLSHLSTRPDSERALAIFAVEQVRKWGGVLEHPASSKLWPFAGLPEPGARDEFGGWTLVVSQWWWGHKADKLTRLYIVGIEPADLPTIPYRIGEPEYVVSTSRVDTSREISKSEREHTPVEFAKWLIEVARLARRESNSMSPTVNLYNEDCIAGMAARLADSSVHLTVTSIPFEELFTYSGKPEDVGNNGSTVNVREGRFALNLRFVISELLRVTAPGCNVAIHIQQLLAYKNQHGFIGRRDFRGAVIDLFSAGGFTFSGEFVITKNPQAMAQRLNLHSLMFVTGKRNSNMLAPAPNDYVLIFSKPGEPETPVRCLYDKEINPGGWVTTEEWIRDAHGVWNDIDEFDILDGARGARESDEEKHVCPLQLEVIRRLVKLYSNPILIQPDVTVLDPFMGIGSTAAVCVELGRNCVGFELKESYYSNSLKNVARARKALRHQTADLFEGIEEGAAA